MTEAKDWVFIFPIIAAIVLLVSLIFPLIGISIFYSGFIDPAIVGNLMPFGMGGITDVLSPYIGLVPEAAGIQTTFQWIGIVMAILFILGALLLIISGLRVKTGNKELKKARKKWLRNGLSYIITELILFLGLAIGIPIALVQAGIGLEMGFFIRSGMILIVVAGGILIFAYILARIAG